MKKSILWIVAVMLTLSSASFAQAINEKGFSFQGYARNVDGSAVSNQTVSVKFTIYPAGNEGSPSFEETQTKDTDAFGIFTAEIGTVNTVIFKALDFINNDFFLKVEISVSGSNLVEISNTRLNSVPYAQASAFAAKAQEATSAVNGVPPGTILPFGGTAVPAGFVACDGRSLDQNDPSNAALFAAINFNWGNDNGKFRVPDLRGYFLRGMDGGAGKDPNAATRVALYAGGKANDNVGSYQDTENLSHTHSGSTSADGNHNHRMEIDVTDGHSGTNVRGSDRPTNGAHNFTNSAGIHSHTFISNPSGGAESRPKNAYVLYIIKL